MISEYIEKIDETIYTKQLENGLKILFVKKPEFNKVVASVTTKIGSINNAFKLDGVKHRISDGIAHFLEHKMFEKEEGDTFAKFSMYGGSANAYTSFDHTSYFFSSSAHFEENLDVLLEMMTTPYYTKETVDKEKGIIGEEIKMYQDDSNWILFFETVRNLYANHPISIDIAGTEETIANITAEELYLCYSTFYHPNNSVITVVGNFDENVALETIQKYYGSINTKNNFEPVSINDTKVHKSSSIVNMDVNNPKCCVGYKQSKDITYDYKRDIAINIYLQMLFGKTSDNYEMLASKGLYPSYSYNEVGNVGFATISSDAVDTNLFFEEIEGLLNQEVREEDFLIFKNKNIGEIVRNFNTVDSIMKMYTDAFVNEYNINDVLKQIEQLTFEDVCEYAKELFDEQNKTQVTILRR